jgi:hypothetical protein
MLGESKNTQALLGTKSEAQLSSNINTSNIP